MTILEACKKENAFYYIILFKIEKKILRILIFFFVQENVRKKDKRELGSSRSQLIDLLLYNFIQANILLVII